MKLRLRPNILAKRLGGGSLSQLMKNFGLGLLPGSPQEDTKNLRAEFQNYFRWFLDETNFSL